MGDQGIAPQRPGPYTASAIYSPTPHQPTGEGIVDIISYHCTECRAEVHERDRDHHGRCPDCAAEWQVIGSLVRIAVAGGDPPGPILMALTNPARQRRTP